MDCNGLVWNPMLAMTRAACRQVVLKEKSEFHSNENTMTKTYHRRTAGWILVYALVHEGWVPCDSVQAQELVTKSASVNAADQEPLVAVTIAEEPTYIDPIVLVPEALRTKLSHSFQEVPLNEVAAWIQSQTGLNVVVDELALDEEGILSSELVTESLTDVPLVLFLDRLERIGVGWRFEGGVIYLQPPKASIKNIQYNIGDLLDQGFKSSELIPALISSVDNESWADNGGTGTAVLLGDVLFVRQNPRTHRRVVAFLESLRHPARRTWIDEPAAHAAIVSALDTTTSVQFKGTALAQAIQSLADQHKLDIRLDRVALRKARISERLPISIEIREQPLRTILDILSSQHQLAWVHRDGVLWVTTRQEAEGASKIALFDVRDLCRNMSDSMSLQSAIEQQSSPDSWHCNGGNGVIAFPRSGIMVISQTEPRLDGVLSLLENYRSALKNSKRRISPEIDPEGYETKYYRLPTVIAQDLQSLLPELIAQESWVDSGTEGALGTIRISRSRSEQRNGSSDKNVPSTLESYSVLIIHQKRRIHAEISTVIQKIEHGDAIGFSQPGLGGMGAGGMGGMGGGMGGFF